MNFGFEQFDNRFADISEVAGAAGSLIDKGILYQAAPQPLKNGRAVLMANPDWVNAENTRRAAQDVDAKDRKDQLKNSLKGSTALTTPRLARVHAQSRPELKAGQSAADRQRALDPQERSGLLVDQMRGLGLTSSIRMLGKVLTRSSAASKRRERELKIQQRRQVSPNSVSVHDYRTKEIPQTTRLGQFGRRAGYQALKAAHALVPKNPALDLGLAVAEHILNPSEAKPEVAAMAKPVDAFNAFKNIMTGKNPAASNANLKLVSDNATPHDRRIKLDNEERPQPRPRRARLLDLAA